VTGCAGRSESFDQGGGRYGFRERERVLPDSGFINTEEDLLSSRMYWHQKKKGVQVGSSERRGRPKEKSGFARGKTWLYAFVQEGASRITASELRN